MTRKEKVKRFWGVGPVFLLGAVIVMWARPVCGDSLCCALRVDALSYMDVVLQLKMDFEKQNR